MIRVSSLRVFWAVSALALGLTSAYFLTLAKTDPWQLFVDTSSEAGFVLTDLQITGAVRTRRSDILAALDIDDGVPLLSIDLIRIREKLEKLNWIKSVELARNLPSGLSVRLIERQPYALWQHNGKVFLIDPDGVVITGRNLEEFKSLRLMVGPNANVRAGEIEATLNQAPELAARVRSAVLVGERRWDVVFNNGLRLKLPERSDGYSAENAWSTFARLEREYALLAREVSVVDMRLQDRIFLRTRPGVKRGGKSYRT